MSASPAPTKADPYKDLSPEQKARVEKALAKANSKIDKPEDEAPQPESNGSAVAIPDTDVVDGEIVGEVAAVNQQLAASIAI